MTTLEEERRELWDGLLDGMRDSEDPDCAVARRRLLRHLVEQAYHPGSSRGRLRTPQPAGENAGRAS